MITKENLSQFTGTEQYRRLGMLFPNFLLTDGTSYLAKEAGTYWLMEEIALSNKFEDAIKQDDKLQNMQFWTLRKGQGHGATLVCERDTNDVAFSKQIEFTDFPFEILGDSFSLWVAPLDEDTKVIYLPSEH